MDKHENSEYDRKNKHAKNDALCVDHDHFCKEMESHLISLLKIFVVNQSAWNTPCWPKMVLTFYVLH